MPKFQDLTEQTFGRLRVRELAGRKGHRVMWLCDCSCGNTKTVGGDSLKSGNTQSCGCLFREAVTTHGQYLDPVYAVWCTMIQRCSNPNHENWDRYGGRGITVDPSWQKSYPTFITDLGPRPPGLTLERRDNNLGYSKANCYWGTHQDQARNTSRNRMLTWNNETRPVWEWIKITGIKKNTLALRLFRGWSDERALSTPTKE